MKDVKNYILQLIKSNERYCYINGCSPSPYMEGSNDSYKKILDFIEDKEKLNENPNQLKLDL
jgi:hypothetical protein